MEGFVSAGFSGLVIDAALEGAGDFFADQSFPDRSLIIGFSIGARRLFFGASGPRSTASSARTSPP